MINGEFYTSLLMPDSHVRQHGTARGALLLSVIHEALGQRRACPGVCSEV